MCLPKEYGLEHKKNRGLPGMVADTFSPRTQEEEAEESLWVPGLPQQQNDTQSQKQTQEKEEKQQTLWCSKHRNMYI